MHIVVLVTAQDKAEAQRIAAALLNQRLAACVNIIEKIDSSFWWQGNIDHALECLLIIKSRRELFAGIEAVVKTLHSYDVPEIIALDIAAGSAEYLKWMDDQVAF